MIINNSILLDASIYSPDSILSIGEGIKISALGICVVMFELALLAVFILVMAKVFVIASKISAKNITFIENPVVEEKNNDGVPLPESNSAGKIDLINVDEPTAAVIMAIVSDNSGIPLNHLSFKSIKLQEDK